MSVSNVTMFEFDTSEELQEWSDWYRDNGPFPNNTLSLFVKTGDCPSSEFLEPKAA